MNKGNQRKTGIVLSYASIFVSTIVQLIYTPFLVRMLGQSEYGLYSIIASLIGYLTVLDLGFGNAIVVYTSKYRIKNEKEKEQKMQGMFKIVFYIISCVVTVIGIILYFNVDRLFGETMTLVELEKAKIMIIILIFNLVITFSFNIYSSIINAHERFIFQKVMSILNTLFKPIIMSIAMCIVITIINLLVVFSNYFYCKKVLKCNVCYSGFDKNIFVPMFFYSIWIFLGTIVDTINWSVDQF
ncbi:MAG: oligosaccharide flippase family protein, partial [Bacilli bacterium]